MSAALTPPRLPAPPTLLALLAMPAMQLWQSTRSPHHSRFLHCWQCRHRSGNATVGHTTRTSCLVAKNRTCNFGNPTVDRAAHAPCIVWQSRQLCSSGIHCWPHHSHFLDCWQCRLHCWQRWQLCNWQSHGCPHHSSCIVACRQLCSLSNCWPHSWHCWQHLWQPNCCPHQRWQLCNCTHGCPPLF